MDHYRGTYSFFRYPNEKIIGFSPILAFINVGSNFLKNSFNMKRDSTFLDELVDELFHSILGNLSPTINREKPIYIIAKSGLLNEFMLHTMTNNIFNFNTDENFNKLIETCNNEYEIFISCKCKKRKNIDECSGLKSCEWGNDECVPTENKKEKIKNLKNFKKKYGQFLKLVDNCINKDSDYVPFYLTGLILTSYWYMIKNHTCNLTDKKYVEEYMKNVKKYIKNEPDNCQTYKNIEFIDNYISKNNILNVPTPLIMIYAIVDNVRYAACFETALNEFFNILFYNKEKGKFIISKKEYFDDSTDEDISPIKPLIDHYNNINDNYIDYTNWDIINNFIKLTTNIPGVEYNLNGYEIKSSYKNLLIILNYFLNTNYDNLNKLLEYLNINIILFNEKNGILKMIIKGEYLKMNIVPGHSYTERIGGGIKFNINDDLFNIFVNILNNTIEREIDSEITLLDYYNQLNKNNYNLPFYEIVEKIDEKYNEINYSYVSKNLHQYTPIINLPDDFFVKFIGLEKITMSRIELKKIPENISLLKKLKKLDFGINKIKVIPLGIDLPSLEFLNLGHNKLTNIPEDMQLPNLKKLDLSSNEGIKKLPNNINLEKIEEIKINYCSLNELPVNLSYLKNIINLSLKNNKLTYLPENINELKNIKTLILDNNSLSFLPENICYLDNLETLSLNNNSIEFLPICISKLGKLKELLIDNNNLSELPKEIVIKSLVTLSLRNNLLEKLYDNILNFDSLNELYLENNNIEKLPKNIHNLKELKKLIITNNKLIKLPKNFSKLKKIDLLSLSHNLLEILPDSFWEFENLRVLYLNNNNLIDIPDIKKENEKLFSINMNNNKIKNIPEDIHYLKNLSIIDLSFNEIERIPNNFVKLINLHNFTINDNKLLFLPKDINLLKLLYSLCVNNNNLISLPDDLYLLSSLSFVNISNNNIYKIPEGFNNIRSKIIFVINEKQMEKIDRKSFNSFYIKFKLNN